MDNSPFTGCIPALMTPCRADRTPDFDALVRKAKELNELGMSGVVYCGSMGDWPLLTDAQRMEGVERLVSAGIPVIVGTGAVNTQSAVAHAAHDQKVGAAGLMLIPRVLSRGSSPAAQKAHFKALLAANGISEDQLTIVPVDFDPTPLMNGDVDGFMAYLTNEAITVEMAGYEVTNLAYAENGLPYVAESYAVTDDYLANNKDLIKAFLTAEIKGWTDAFTQPVDDTVALVTKYYNESASAGDLTFGDLDPDKVAAGVEAQAKLISTEETEANGLFTISDDLKTQTLASLAASGWDLTADKLFDTTIIDEIYAENPDLKSYLP